MFAKINTFIREVGVELKKVAWPARDELVGATTIVIISVLIMSVFIGVCDFVFSKIVHIIIR